MQHWILDLFNKSLVRSRTKIFKPVGMDHHDEGARRLPNGETVWSLVRFCCGSNQNRLIMVSGMQQTRTRPVILLVEDYADSRQILTLLLESLGYCVFSAANGREALNAAAKNQIDLILTDFNLPDMTGPTVVRSVRELANRPAYIPVVILTASDGCEHRSLAAEAGCDAFLIKPADFEILRATIDRLLQVDQRAQRSTELSAWQ
jgi:CheY-like chemotaxis protein